MQYESSSTALVPMFQDVVYKVIPFVTLKWRGTYDEIIAVNLKKDSVQGWLNNQGRNALALSVS